LGDVTTDASNNGSTLYSPLFPPKTPVVRMDGMLKSARTKRELRLRRRKTRR
jgi:hypothetical protein